MAEIKSFTNLINNRMDKPKNEPEDQVEDSCRRHKEGI